MTSGAGAGGLGASKSDGSGAMNNLKSVTDFEGPYARARTGLALGEHGKGKMFLCDAKGVVTQLGGTRKGLALSTGADAMVISFAN